MKDREQKHLKKSENKKKQRSGTFFNIIAVLLLSVAAVATGIALPGLSAAIQSRKLDSFSRREELSSGMLCLTSDDRKLDKLKSVSCRSESSMVELEKGSFSTAEEAKGEINELLRILNDAGVAADRDRYWDIKSSKVYLLLPDGENPESNIIWVVEAEDGHGNKLSYCMDDSTGNVLSAQVQGVTYDAAKEEILKKLVISLGRYYAFSNIEVSYRIYEPEKAGARIIFTLSGEEIWKTSLNLSENFSFNS